ncbi:hypothetical protein H6761_03165 [Candidatus Nomurabacteria bacterium]|nr:hypothetical protein [Candidatus Nomurabacteria bacterium]
MKKTIVTIFSAGLWITFSEFFRNEILLKNYWTEHFESLGLTFTTTAINGLIWLVWSFSLAYLIYQLLKKFDTKKTISLVWLGMFWMMWLTIYNLQTLPLKILIFAIPLSLLEIMIAVLIIQKLKKSLL